MTTFDIQDYLKDLHFFASLRVDFGTPDGSPDVEEVAQLLADAFLQPYDRLIDEENEPGAARPVHQIRLAVEILRRYLAPLLVDTTKAAARYLLAAYQALLLNLGTSFAELRILPTDGDPELEKARRDLANRLGLDRPERLDELLMRPDELTEEKLERLFGLASTTRDPFEASQTRPAVLQWRADRLRNHWKAESFPGQADATRPVPVIDPDLISEDMVIDPEQVGPGGFIDSEVVDLGAREAALALWGDRTEEISDLIAEVETEIDKAIASEATLLAAYDRVIETFLGPVDLEAILTSLTEGTLDEQQDEEGQLPLLDLQALRHLVRLRKLSASGTLTESEWADATGILVLFNKRQRFADWRDEEEDKGLFLSPDFFQLTDTSARRPLPPWRATHQARLDWEGTLRARTQQLQATVQALEGIVDAAESVALVQLRDGLIATLAEHLDEPNSDLLANKLTDRLQLDFKNRASSKTTRLEQAAETLQGLLFALRMGRSLGEGLPDDSPVDSWSLKFGPNFTEEDFDLEWQWRGAYAMQRAAERVLDHPENLLLPSLRDQGVALQQLPTDAFWTLIDDLRDRPQLKRGEARRLAGLYLAALGKELAERDPAVENIVEDIEERLAEITGNVGVSFEITEQLSEHDLLVRKKLINELFDEQEITRTYKPSQDEDEILIEDPHLASDWLQEIFYFVPMAIALQLQRSSEFLAALEWYQTVYAYSFAPDERKIYHGLQLEGVFSDVPRRTAVWLREQLNPHFFARERKHAYTRFTILSIVQCLLDYADSEFTAETAESLPRARTLYLTALDLARSLEMPTSNPVTAALRQHAELNLDKLRSGRNIAGMERPLRRMSGTGDGIELAIIGTNGQVVVRSSELPQPTPYRYAVLIQRSKELVGIAQQMEAAFLSALEKRDDEAYTLLQAGHDLQLSKARVQLQELRVSEAEGGVTLTSLQKGRAEFQSEALQEFLDAGINQYEHALLARYREAGDARQEAARLQFAASGIREGIGTLGGDPLKFAAFTLGTILGGQALNAGIEAIRAETRIQETSVFASHEQRRQEWRLQKSLADKDVAIAGEQVDLALKQKTIAEKEMEIVSQQAEHAEVTVNFLANKFTNTDLYEWMSGVLGRVYSYFLQQATSMAQLAQNQLAFERQELPPSFIQTDYWQPPAHNNISASSNGEAPDRLGMTGSARLLQDIYRLDQYAFETNKRKLQLSQTFSLAQLFPFEFERFRETGVFPFATPTELFDRGFPGHYLRLIKRVRTSVIALLPPVHGIRATLGASGISHVVTGKDVFQTAIVRRDPELIAFTSSTAATGLFELEPEGELLLPFEGSGVDTTWKLELPKAANAFDYRTLADVLLTVEYTALHSYDYRKQVIQQLNRSVSSERSFSFRQQFADAFYDLNNPGQSDTPMVVRFKTRPEDFPPNLNDLRIEHVLLFFARAESASFEVSVAHLRFTRQGSTETVGGSAISIDGIISTRRGDGITSTQPGTASNWTAMIGKLPFGDWELALLDMDEVRDRFKNGEIEDLLLVITYGGETPAWPA